MNTPTHFLMTAALRKALPHWRMDRTAVLWGSVAPDLPLYALSAGALCYYQYVAGWSLADSARHIFATLYFEDPVWLSLHNSLHSPLSLLVLLGLIRLIRLRTPGRANWLRWFLLACLLHSVVDIFTHHDDGPLLLWPLDWRLRFPSPVSYWDHRHFGSQAARFELVLILGCILYLIGPWLYQRRRYLLARGRVGSEERASAGAAGRERD